MRVAKTTFHYKSLGYFWLSALVLLLSGCASSWSAKVTTFQQWPTELYQARYQIVGSAEQKNSLEFQSVADSVRIAMGAAGLVEGGDESRLAVELSYGNPVQQEWVERYNDPYDPFFYGGPFSTGIWAGFGSMHFRGMYYPTPQYVSVPVNVYNNTLSVVIKDRELGMKEVFKVTAINKSNDDNLVSVIPLLAKAAFTNFPGMNGKVQYVEVK
ncbi:hypothetical protein PAEH1_04760 [Paenalcaligenes hominis]|uniref:DUF4136 domain-containing protein n=1 Tax=Paenalcaligenes hominis TaxID=643674 RepID=A0A1U9JZ86_9BURK|nr:DUF4136 domain-containing protein [Paenalcaligenes hominis]AQS51054.1 hypothetical protein PAEH1_04760 [Paenalcaligenes hominis]